LAELVSYVHPPQQQLDVADKAVELAAVEEKAGLAAVVAGYRNVGIVKDWRSSEVLTEDAGLNWFDLEVAFV
jgi:hypothetical protein